MKKIGHSSWLILFYILLISIDHSRASNHELKEELRLIHQEIGLLRDENHHQNMEITLLKEKFGSTKGSDDHKMVVSASPDDNRRNKRPVRLLPPYLLYGERKNETEQQKQINRRRYEQPANCSDLALLGFTLNGFYLVKSIESSTKSTTNNNDIKLDTVFCAFKQPEGTFNLSRLEKRIISRRETKPSSGRVLYLHATRETDFIGGSFHRTMTFDDVKVNLGNAFDGNTGTFTVRKSGVYLFIFRGRVTFSKASFGKQFWMAYTKNGTPIAKNSLIAQNKPMEIEIDKLTKGNRGDKFTVEAYFNENGLEFFLHYDSTFTVYMLEDQI